jgi:hypothetical protein
MGVAAIATLFYADAVSGMTTFTTGETPDQTIREALARETGDANYSMELVGEDAEALRAVVNQGIDAHLTAVVHSHFQWQGHRLVCDVDPTDMQIILRRLHDDGSDVAMSLRSGILSTIGIEEV